MRSLKYLALLPLLLTPLSSCVTTDGAGVVLIENLSDAEYAKWQLYVYLGVKIGANRLLEEGAVTEQKLNVVADAIMLAIDRQVVPGTNSIITPVLEDLGLTGDEIALVLLIAEQELLARGALDWINPETGLVALSPRTKEMLSIIANALKSAAVITDAEVSQAQMMQADFSQ